MDHLRSVGLLPPLPLVVLDDDDDNNNNNNITARESGDGNGSTNDDSDSNTSNSNCYYYDIRLLRSAHITYLSNALYNPLPKGFVSLDASHPWMVYWCLHSLDLLGYFDNNDDDDDDCISHGKRATSAWMHNVEILQKRTLLQRIVSTLQHCYMEVRLEFDYEEDVVANGRLKELYDAQKNNNNDASSDGDDGNDDITTNESSSSKPKSVDVGSAEMRRKVMILGGGFGGGPQQLPHVATTYAAVLALSIVAGIGMMTNSQSSSEKEEEEHPYHEPGRSAMELLTKIRLRLYAFFLSLRVVTNTEEDERHDERRTTTAFRMQHDGEIDVRASYCILAPCYLLGLLRNEEECKAEADINDDGDAANAITTNDYNPLLCPSIPRYIASCQTFEGGFGAEPFNEAHGGYTFCALAALRILDAIPLIDVDALSSWLARRQMSYEGGFCGRTNKLVDGCYSFWQGGAVAVLDSWLHNYVEGEERWAGAGDDVDTQAQPREAIISFDEVMLQRYILLCAQDVYGGLRDKPSKSKDFYHSCYNLSGLSVAQHALKPWPAPSIDAGIAVDDGTEEKFNNLFGDTKTNIVGRTDPVINIREERAQFMLDHYE